MKLYKYCLAFLALTTVTVSGCKNEDINEEHHYDNKLYVSSTPVCDDLLIKPSIKIMRLRWMLVFTVFLIKLLLLKRETSPVIIS